LQPIDIIEIKYIEAAHNPLVAGSSPGGPTKMEKPLIFEVSGFFSLNTQLLIWKLSFTCEANLISFWKKYSLRFLANL